MMGDENHLHVFQVLSYDLIWGRLSINRNNGGDIVTGTPIVQTGQNRPGPGGWAGVSFLPCGNEFQSLLACARFKLATHGDETLSIPLLMPGGICFLEDWLPR